MDIVESTSTSTSASILQNNNNSSKQFEELIEKIKEELDSETSNEYINILRKSVNDNNVKYDSKYWEKYLSWTKQNL